MLACRNSAGAGPCTFPQPPLEGHALWHARTLVGHAHYADKHAAAWIAIELHALGRHIQHWAVPQPPPSPSAIVLDDDDDDDGGGVDDSDEPSPPPKRRKAPAAKAGGGGAAVAKERGQPAARVATKKALPPPPSSVVKAEEVGEGQQQQQHAGRDANSGASGPPTLLVFEECDVLVEADKGFLAALTSIIQESKVGWLVAA